jgi:sensor histidine kinase YesM
MQVKDKWFRVLIVLIPFLLVTYISGSLTNITAARIIRILVSLCAIILVTEGSRYLVYNSRRWFSRRWRLLYVFVIGVAWTGLVLALSIVFRKLFITGILDLNQAMDTQVQLNGKQLVLGIFGYSLLNGTINFLVMMGLYEAIYRNAQLRYAVREKEKIEKEKLSAELSQLKGIINPHFLFNNLNSLSSLIAEDPEQAQEFLDELTKVFRYLLKNNQTELTTLGEEIKFIQTYYQLLQTRYGAGISMKLDIDSNYYDMLIPPLTLQLLVENAVKHNRIQKENPVRIELLTIPGSKLIVRNNVLPKEGKSESSGIGLYSINARYQMLNNPGLVIEKNEKEFSVSVSLISAIENKR